MMIASAIKIMNNTPQVMLTGSIFKTAALLELLPLPHGHGSLRPIKEPGAKTPTPLYLSRKAAK
jgi:hypothetical protein